MKHISRILGISLLGVLIHIMSLTALSAQEFDFKGTKVGFFLSSKQVSYGEDYYLPISQFLKLEDDRSWVDKVKTELLIRVGESFARELQSIAITDSVYFLNADLERGQKVLDAYNGERKRMRSSEAFGDMDYVIILSKMEMSTRTAKSVFIRSNKMYTERIKVKKAELEMEIYAKNAPQAPLLFENCFDEQKAGKVPAHFDIYRQNSGLGKFFSKLFSSWWQQVVEENPVKCGE